jgi:uncharacterized protein (TIGR02646 family)
MHKLDRTRITEPVCLAGFDHRSQMWDDLKPDEKQQIRASLEQMQDLRCAYCESRLYADGHIEHFRRKGQNHFPHLTFVWSNLFLSCGSVEHCGHYKDRQNAPAYSPDDLIKPDEHEPDHYFYFFSSGEIRIRGGISEGDSRRASETIRVFNLNCGSLNAARRRALRFYEERQPDVLEVLMQFDETTAQMFIAEEIEATRLEPHWTVIRHYFEKVH